METFPYIILFLSGAFSGLYGSTVGSAGLINLPILLFLDLPSSIAIATNRLAVVFLSLSSSVRYYREKKLNLKIGFLFGLIAAIGSLLGSHLLLSVDEGQLNFIVAIFLVAVALILIFKNQLGIKEKHFGRKNWMVALPTTFLLGIYGGFFGIGFGTFITFVFVVVGFNFIKSAAIARVVGLLMSSMAAAVFILNDVIHYPYALTLGAGLAIGGWVGAGIGVKKGNAYIRVLYFIILLATLLKLLSSF